jgi:hypothetical protein
MKVGKRQRRPREDRKVVRRTQNHPCMPTKGQHASSKRDGSESRTNGVEDEVVGLLVRFDGLESFTGRGGRIYDVGHGRSSVLT